MGGQRTFAASATNVRKGPTSQAETKYRQPIFAPKGTRAGCHQPAFSLHLTAVDGEEAVLAVVGDLFDGFEGLHVFVGNFEVDVCVVLHMG